jgi:RNA polymerase sigma factor (sigma-70 family)
VGTQNLQGVVRELRRLAGGPTTVEISDQELLARFCDLHEEAAFETLVRRHGPMVRELCRRLLGQEADADDAFQAVFLILIRKARSIHKGQSLASWLYGVAYRTARHMQRDAARRRNWEKRQDPRRTKGAADEAVWREMFELLDAELYRLAEIYRSPLILCHLEGQTRDQAVKYLGWSLRTLDRRLERGRELLRLRLSRRGVTLSAALLSVSLAGSELKAALPACLVAPVVAAARTGVLPGPAALLAERVIAAASALKVKFALLFALSMMVIAAGTVGFALDGSVPRQPEAPKGARQRADGTQTQAESRQHRDRYGDPLPAGALARLGSTRLRHGFFTLALAFSPDGKMLASAGAGRGLCLWDTATGKEVHTLVPAGQCYAVAFSPNGRSVASSFGIKQLGLWDTATGTLIRSLQGSESGTTQAIAFAPDGQTLALAGYDSVVRLCDVASGQEIRQLKGHEDGIRTLAFAPDGHTLASGSMDKTVRLWDPATGKELARLSGHTGAVMRVVFSPDGKTLLSAETADGSATGKPQGTIRFWDVATAKEVRSLDSEDVMGTALIFAGADFLATGHQDGSIRVWNAATGEKVRQWQAHFYPVYALAVSSDGKTLASGASSSTIRLWDAATGQERFPQGGAYSAPYGLSFATDGSSVLLRSRDHTQRRWDWFHDKETVTTWKSQPWGLTNRITPDGKTMAAVHPSDHTIGIWTDPESKEPRRLGKHDGRVLVLEFSPDSNLLASGGRDALIRIWDLHAGKELGRIQVDHQIECLAFSPDGKTLASGGAALKGPTIQLWEVPSGKRLRSLDHNGEVADLAFSPSGKLLAAADFRDKDGPHLWDLHSGREIPLPRAGQEGNALTFSPDSRLLAWGSVNGENRIHIVEIASRQEVLHFEGHHSGILRLAFSPTGQLLASGGGDATVLIWDLTGHYHEGRFTPTRLASQDLEACWANLSSSDAAKAYRAEQALMRATPEQVVPFLNERLPLSALPDAEQIAAWIRDLDNSKYAVRTKAGQQLAKLGPRIEGALRAALAAKPTLEARQRLEKLLEALDPVHFPELLRRVRAIAVLEHLATPEAAQVLAQPRKTERGNWLEREATAALKRLLR